jgi:hypothetical protein
MTSPRAYTYIHIVGSVIFPQVHNISYSTRTVGNKAKYKLIFGMKTTPGNKSKPFLLRATCYISNDLYAMQVAE